MYVIKRLNYFLHFIVHVLVINGVCIHIIIWNNDYLKRTNLHICLKCLHFDAIYTLQIKLSRIFWHLHRVTYTFLQLIQVGLKFSHIWHTLYILWLSTCRLKGINLHFSIYMKYDRHPLSGLDQVQWMSTLWKESLNSDGQQFCQYQQNEQSPTSHLNWSLNTKK